MPTEVTKVILGTPGPGGGVTASDLAAYMPKTGGTFTGAPTFKPSSDGTGFVLAEQADGTDLIVLDTTNKKLKFYGGLDLEFYSDAGVTQVAAIDGATGAIQTDSTITADGGRVIGDEITWGFVFNEGGSVLTTGVKIDYPVPYNCKVTQWDLEANESGSIVIDVAEDTYGNFPPTFPTDSITTSEKPTLSSAQKNQDTSLNSGNGWSLTKGRTLRLTIDSVTSITRCTLLLHVERT